MKPYIEIFGHDTCAYCFRAKTLISAQGYEYVYYNIRSSNEVMADFVVRTHNAKTVPQIIINGRLVGGYEDLRSLIASGDFQQIIGGE